jgi:LCP family protein required for cell wall assembly
MAWSEANREAYGRIPRATGSGHSSSSQSDTMKSSLSLLLLLVFLTACVLPWEEASAPLPVNTPTTLYLVTAAGDSTPTPTPFQPLAEDGETAWMGATPLPPTATFDPNAVLPTAEATPQSFYAPPYAPAPALSLSDDQTVTFLLLGSDKRSGETYFRTDTIVIAAVRPASGQVTLVSVPRDLYVYIPSTGMDRINAAYEYGEMYHYPGGGAALLKDTILYNLGIRIDHLAIVDFDVFRRIVDTLGGIDLPVFCAYTDWHLIDPSLDPELESSWALYTVKPGVIHMDGDLALWYARSRKKSDDFNRGRRQQEVLRAIYARARQTDIFSKIPQLYNDFVSNVITDLTLPDLLQLAPLALQLKNADIRSYYISKDYVSNYTTPGGAAVLLPNGPAVQSMLQQALAPSAVLPVVSAITVEVRNGTTNPGWDALAAERLNYAGYNTRLGTSDQKSDISLLYDLGAVPDIGRVAALLAILKLPSSAFVAYPRESDVPYVLLVGADYQPCFNPTNLAP